MNPLWVNFEKNHRGFFEELQIERGFPGTSGKTSNGGYPPLPYCVG